MTRPNFFSQSFLTPHSTKPNSANLQQRTLNTITTKYNPINLKTPITASKHHTFLTIQGYINLQYNYKNQQCQSIYELNIKHKLLTKFLISSRKYRSQRLNMNQNFTLPALKQRYPDLIHCPERRNKQMGTYKMRKYHPYESSKVQRLVEG